MNIAPLANPLVRIDPDGRIQVYVYLASLGEAELDVLRSLDVEVEVINKDPAIVQGLAPFDRIEEIAASPFVQRVTQPSYGRPRAVSKTTEGDTILKADQLRALGIDGTEMKAGIISDGANNWIESQASGDLPASGITRYGSCTPSAPDFSICTSGRTCNEGTAMAEIVHDIAPGARIAVAAAGTSLEFIARVNDLVNTFGADIIVDDLGFSFEPYFEDGLLAQAVAGVKDQVVFVSSAGNAARKHYEADYKDNSNLHDFGLRAGGSTDLTMDVLVGPGEFLFTVLQWNDQFGLSANDYDLFLFDGAETTIGASSRDLQDGTQDPREFVCYFNPAFFQVRRKIVVGRFSGAGRRLEMFLRGGIQIDEYNVPDGSIFGHSAVPGVLAVGAIDAADPGNDTIEPFSSRGPSRIDFSSLQDAGAGVIDVPNLNFSSLSGFDGTSYRGQTFIALPGLAQELTIYVRPKAIHFRVLLTEVDKADGKIFPRTVLFESSRLTTPSSGPLTPITVDLGGINLVSGQLYAFYWIPLLRYRRTHKTMPTITHGQGQLFLIRVKTFIQKDK